MLRAYLFDYTANTINHPAREIYVYSKLLCACIVKSLSHLRNRLERLIFCNSIIFLALCKILSRMTDSEAAVYLAVSNYSSFVIPIRLFRFTLYFVLFFVIRFTSYDYKLEKFLLSKFTKKAKPIRLKEFSFLFPFAVINFTAAVDALCPVRRMSKNSPALSVDVRASFR